MARDDDLGSRAPGVELFVINNKKNIFANKYTTQLGREATLERRSDDRIQRKKKRRRTKVAFESSGPSSGEAGIAVSKKGTRTAAGHGGSSAAALAVSILALELPWFLELELLLSFRRRPWTCRSFASVLSCQMSMSLRIGVMTAKPERSSINVAS